MSLTMRVQSLIKIGSVGKSRKRNKESNKQTLIRIYNISKV